MNYIYTHKKWFSKSHEVIKPNLQQKSSKSCLMTISRGVRAMQIQVSKEFQLLENQPETFHKNLSVNLISLQKYYAKLSSPPNLALFYTWQLTNLNRLGASFISQLCFIVGVQCRGYRIHNCPCNGGPPMTPNQSRFRASSHKDLSFFSFFWIIKNLLPKGQNPSNNNLYKRPQATRPND